LAFLARELTKCHEELLALPLDALLTDVTQNPRKGEITLILEGAPKDPYKAHEAQADIAKDAETKDPLEILTIYKEEILADPRKIKDISREFADKFSLSKSTVYSIISSFRDEKN
jgi:16S rRNA C1402 (ribose-2'-O) methylase RsmI